MGCCSCFIGQSLLVKGASSDSRQKACYWVPCLQKPHQIFNMATICKCCLWCNSIFSWWCGFPSKTNVAFISVAAQFHILLPFSVSSLSHHQCLSTKENVEIHTHRRLQKHYKCPSIQHEAFHFSRLYLSMWKLSYSKYQKQYVTSLLFLIHTGIMG